MLEQENRKQPNVFHQKNEFMLKKKAQSKAYMHFPTASAIREVVSHKIRERGTLGQRQHSDEQECAERV